MLVDYYAHLGKGEKDFGAYYLPDGVIDVNGLKGQGEAAIKDVYKKIAAGTPKRPGHFSHAADERQDRRQRQYGQGRDAVDRDQFADHRSGAEVSSNRAPSPMIW